ncbi:putative surface protein SACOL0050 [Chironomus tepperi]|uniref:putative surface protein SACOL0050 n=1 Tax=Chironomus tepperi TaxID=113505 RepID=UPI00391FC5E7
MSQISHSQLALKKRVTPVVFDNETTNKAGRKSRNGHKAENGDKSNGNDKSDKDIIILDDEYVSIPIGREEVVDEQILTQPDESSPSTKSKRGRRTRGSTNSRESSEFTTPKTEEVPKTPEPTPKKEEAQPESNAQNEEQVVPEELPESSPKETKVVKLNTELPVSSKRRSDRLQNASTIVNLSTVSIMDQSTKVSNDTEMTIETPSTERKVSGRRSTRPIDDIKFTYRSPDPDESVANATIGSEIGDNLLETPQTDRKRRIDSMETLDSPKRSRLDISALFNNFYSPVTMLRSRFSRANLASTPKVGDILNETASSIDLSDSELKDVDLNEKSEEKKEEKVEGSGTLKFIVKPAAKKSVCSIM